MVLPSRLIELLQSAWLAATPGFPDFELSVFPLEPDFASVLRRKLLLISETTKEFGGSIITSLNSPPAWYFGVPAFDTICAGPLSAPCTIRGGSGNTDTLEAGELLGLSPWDFGLTNFIGIALDMSDQQMTGLKHSKKLHLRPIKNNNKENHKQQTDPIPELIIAKKRIKSQPNKQ
jgi:hypothetical protein